MKINNDNVSTTVSVDDSVTTNVKFDTSAKENTRKAADDHIRNVVQPRYDSLSSGYRIKRTPATFRRIQTLKLSDAELTEVLKTHKGRMEFGYNYLEKVEEHGMRLQQNMDGQRQYWSMENILAFRALAADDSYELNELLEPNVWDEEGVREVVKPGRFVLKDTLTGKEYDIIKAYDTTEGSPEFFRLNEEVEEVSVRIDLWCELI